METWLTENYFVQILFEHYSIFQLDRVCDLKKKAVVMLFWFINVLS